MLYGQIVEQVHAVSSARVAEAAKLWENTFRAINIGMANEMAKLCNALGIDTWEVVRCGGDKAVWLYAVLSGAGDRRPLHPARSALFVVEGASARV